jgi:hypothetical protein
LCPENRAYIISVTLALTFAALSHAANKNPASIEFVELQIEQLQRTIQSQISQLQGTTVYTVGQSALGGIVFYVDSTGTHGLVAASNPNGTASGKTWDGGLSNFIANNDDIIVNATGDGLGAGALNTSLMVGGQSGYAAYLSSPINGAQSTTLVDMAAQYCVNYSVQADGSVCPQNTSGATCIGDWYLPSLYELNQMYLQKSALHYPLDVNQDAFIWSSTEMDQNNAWRINFTVDSNQKGSTLKSSSSGFWCIHAF